MARSSGFKMTRHLRNFLRVLGVTEEKYTELGITEAGAVFEIRSIVGKYQPVEGIQSDLEEAAQAETQEPEGD